MNAGWRCRCIRAVRGATLLPVKPSATAIAADLTSGERDYICLEFDMSFLPLPNAADRSQLKVREWKTGEPKLSPVVQGLLR